MVMKLAALALAALALTACGQDEVQVVLTPATPELAVLLLEADARWEAAGVGADRIIIGEGGAPVTLSDEQNSYTQIDTAFGEMVGINWMRLGRLDPDHALHEMGHALGINDDAQEVNHLHGPECDATPRPVMCAKESRFIITEADLDLACNVGSCAAYEPEAEGQ